MVHFRHASVATQPCLLPHQSVAARTALPPRPLLLVRHVCHLHPQRLAPASPPAQQGRPRRRSPSTVGQCDQQRPTGAWPGRQGSLGEEDGKRVSGLVCVNLRSLTRSQKPHIRLTDGQPHDALLAEAQRC